MALLAGRNYDPPTLTSHPTSSVIPMTAFDTTNLRLTFTAPANGRVVVRIRCTTCGASPAPTILLGVLQGNAVVARVSPIGALQTRVHYGFSLYIPSITQEALFSVGGLTPGQQYTWDAAYGVEVGVSDSRISYGGPNDGTLDNAYGGLQYEIHDAPTLLATTLYDPPTARAFSTGSVIPMTAFDTTNLRLTFTAPATGSVLVRMVTLVSGALSHPLYLLGVLEGGTVRLRARSIGGQKIASSTGHHTGESSAVVTGLMPGQQYTWDAAYGVERSDSDSPLRCGGPNDNIAANAYGGFLYEIWGV